MDEKTAAKADVKVQKQTWGILSVGAVLDISNTSIKTGPVYIAEGPETGLNIYAAMPGTQVRVNLSTSNFKNINSKIVNRPIVPCLDNDGHTRKLKSLSNLSVKDY